MSLLGKKSTPLALSGGRSVNSSRVNGGAPACSQCLALSQNEGRSMENAGAEKTALGSSSQQCLFEGRGLWHISPSVLTSCEAGNDPRKETMNPPVSIPWIDLGSRKGSLSKIQIESFIAVWLKPQTSEFTMYDSAALAYGLFVLLLLYLQDKRLTSTAHRFLNSAFKISLVYWYESSNPCGFPL